MKARATLRYLSEISLIRTRRYEDERFIAPPGAGSFYPVDPLGLPRTIVCRGRGQIRVERAAVDAWRYDTIALGDVRGTTWVGDDGEILHVDRRSSALVPRRNVQA